MSGEGSSSSGQDKASSASEDHGEGEAVSMVEILAEEQQLEADAKAVLGDSDEHNCTYIMGYVPRQALYACMTCVPESKPSAGVCLACSYECHEGHDLVELYTKRNFRCDCGNSKFGDSQCKLQKDKCSVNPDNSYNQNFRGKYCTCHRPYPDPDDSIEDEMIQCITCEDWFHGRHLITQPPENYDEMICHKCMAENQFLWPYTIYCMPAPKKEPSESASSDSTQTPSTDKETAVSSSDDNAKQTKDDVQHSKEEAASPTEPKTEEKPVNVVDDVPDDSDQKEDSCSYAKLKVPVIKGATFWPLDWRAKLCKCKECMAKYEEKSMSFLLLEDDTVHAYEERGKKKLGTTSDYDQGLQALSSLNRIQQVEVVQGYNDLKGELKDYLKKFAENGKVVREEDIREFFSALQSRKKQRTVNLQWSCK